MQHIKVCIPNNSILPLDSFRYDFFMQEHYLGNHLAKWQKTLDQETWDTAYNVSVLILDV